MRAIDRELLKACEKGDIHTAQTLLQQGANPNSHTDPWPHPTPLLIASKNGHIPIIQLLGQYGANPHTADKNGWTALHHATLFKQYQAVQYLVTELKLDPNSKNYKGISPFIIAAQNGDIDMLKLLIQLGANPHTTDQNGRTAFHYATERNQYETAQHLITELQLNPNTQDRYGVTPLMLAAENGDTPMLRLLILLGADSTTTDYFGRNTLHYATERNQYETAQYLITELQLNPNTQDRYGITPLMIAAKKGDTPMLRHLILLGANPSIADHQGRNALHHAVIYYRRFMVQYLIINLNFDPNAQDHDGNTPLHFAIENNDFDTAKTLVQLGAHLHIPNKHNITPFSIARKYMSRIEKQGPSHIIL